jgi:hypothetical protein
VTAVALAAGAPTALEEHERRFHRTAVERMREKEDSR